MGNVSGEWIIYGVEWDDPLDSWKQIVQHIREIYPIATEKQIRKILR